VLSGEASPTIGTGHVMRLSAVAEELISRGLEVIFVGRIIDVDWLKSRILTQGFSRVVFEEKSFAADPRSDVLILDSYTKKSSDMFVAKSNWNKVVLIADKSTPLYMADLVFHPNISEAKIEHRGESFHSGPLYVPFRQSIKGKEVGANRNSILKILLVGGGTDPYSFVENVARVLSQIDADFEARLFTNNLDMDNLDSRFMINKIGHEFDKYANLADLAFSTSGTTSLEFLARQIPTGVGCSIDNQEDFYNKMSAIGVAIPIGRVFSGSWKLNVQSIRQLVVDDNLRSELRVRVRDFVDLKGASRIVDLILDL
jgi:spore coat polysaccharide biosynthesis predicted glycosyltransferase SpsG